MLLELPGRNMKRIMPHTAVSDIRPPFSCISDFPVFSDSHDHVARNHSRANVLSGSSPRNRNHEILFDLPHPPFAFKLYFTYHSQKGVRGFSPADAGATAASRFVAARQAGPHRVKPGAVKRRSHAFFFPLSGRVIRNGNSFCFVTAPGVHDIVFHTRYTPMVMRRPMRRERRTRWTIRNMRRN